MVESSTVFVLGGANFCAASFFAESHVFQLHLSQKLTPPAENVHYFFSSLRFERPLRKERAGNKLKGREKVGVTVCSLCAMRRGQNVN